MEENEILGFDPTTLVDFMDNNTQEMTTEELEKILDEEGYNEWYLSAEKMMEETHKNNCLKHRRFYYPFNTFKTLYVYLAGKINKYDWRELIVGYRCGGLYGGDNVDILKYTVKYNDNITITGPWFLACDHGCYHGENSHGLGVCQLGCGEANGDNYSEKQVYDICLRQIDKSDVVFAYIDDVTCYGSIYEIAHAVSCNKYVIIIFSNEEIMSDMWFMCQGADIVEVLKEGQTIKEKFDETIKILNTEY